MSIYTRIRDWFKQPQDTTTSNPAQWLVDWVRPSTSDSGIEINGASILQSGPVWQAVTIISGDLGQLPLRVMKRQGDDDTERDRTHQSHKLFNQAPNSEMNPSTFKELLQQWALLWGNGIAAIVRTGSRPTQLVPLLPDRTSIDRDDSGQLWYLTKINEGTEDRRFRPENILHIAGMTSDGLWGMSVIELMKNCAGLDLALLKHGNKTFSKGTRLSGVLSRPVDAGKWSKEARQNLRREWKQMHEGLDATEAVAVLQDGMEFHPMSISNVDAQWVEAVKLSREKVAAWFNLPPHKLGAMQESSVRANLEEQNRDYLNTTLMRWLVKWEEECNRKLLTMPQKERETHFFKWNTASMLRGSLLDRYNAYMIGRTGEWLSPNDVRKLEDMNRIDGDGGDEYGNPNTSSPTTEPPSPNDEDEEPENGVAVEAHRALILDRAEQLLKIEQQKVARAAKKGGNFVEWVDRFYGEEWPQLASEYLGPATVAAASVGVSVAHPTTVARAHGEASHRQLMDLSGVVGPDQLAAQVTQATRRWPAREGDLVDSIMGANYETV